MAIGPDDIPPKVGETIRLDDDDIPPTSRVPRLEDDPKIAHLYRKNQQSKTENAAPPDDDIGQGQSNDDAPPGSSKEKYHRLNPYYEIIIKQLQIRFDDYVIPDDFTHKLADGFSITNRGDIHSNALLLTITKLRPLITKKLDISWAELRKILNTIIKRIKDQQYDYYTFDTIPDDKWFHTDKKGVPQSDYMDIALAIKRLTSCKTMFDEWDETCYFKYQDEAEINKLDAICDRLSVILHDKYQMLVSSDKHLERAIRITFLNQEHRFNSRLDFLNPFVAHYDPEFKCIDEMIQILACEDNVYNREAIRMLLIGSIQRSYYPGCDLPRLITLYSDQQIHKSTLCRLLAGNTTFNGYQWFTDKNLLKEKNEVSRYSYTVGNAIIEFGERNFAGVTIEEFKQFVSSMKDVRRPLFKNEAEKRLRWYDCIATTNKFQYNTDTENLRDWGIQVGIGGKMIDTDRFLELRQKIFGWAVWNVKRGMNGAPDIRLRDIARTYQEERIEYNDTMELIEPVFAFAHLSDKIVGVEPSAKDMAIMEKYEISHKFDKALQKHMYLISSAGIRNFATDYSNFMKRHNIPIHKRAIEDAMRKLKWTKMNNKTTMRAPVLDTTIRGYYLVVDDFVAMEQRAWEYIKREANFIKYVTSAF